MRDEAEVGIAMGESRREEEENVVDEGRKEKKERKEQHPEMNESWKQRRG